MQAEDPVAQILMGRSADCPQYGVHHHHGHEDDHEDDKNHKDDQDNNHNHEVVDSKTNYEDDTLNKRQGCDEM